MATRRLVAGDMEADKGMLRFRPTSVAEAIDYLTDDDDNWIVALDYFAVYEVLSTEEEDRGQPEADESPPVRDWDSLAPSTRRRYQRSSRLQEVARAQYGPTGTRAELVQRWYEHGGSMTAARGHQSREEFGELRRQIVAPPRRLGYELWIDRGRKK